LTADDSVWESGDVAAALEHYLRLDDESADALLWRLDEAGVLDQIKIPEDESIRFQYLALAVQDLWLAERFRSRSSDADHFGRLRARFFAALRTIGEHGAALEGAGLVILDPSRPWIAPLLAEALATAPIVMDADGPLLAMAKQ
jgi:hypothetical protein